MGGDFNARIGEEETAYVNGEQEEEAGRRSKDKVRNMEGETLLRLTEERAWTILNGNSEGDREGEYTYIRGRGASVIDYAIVNIEGVEKINKFRVGNRIEAELPPAFRGGSKVEKKGAKKRIEESIEKVVTVWNVEGIQRYKEQLVNIKFKERKVESKWEKLKATVEGCMVKKKVQVKIWKLGHHFWWDRKCTKEKRKVAGCFKKWKKGTISREAYLGKKKEFRTLCERKETAKKEKEWKEIREVKTEKQIWKYINKERGKESKGITMEEWEQHFITLLNGSRGKQEAESKREVGEEEQEEEITNKEIIEQIRKLGKRKAAGSDRIPGEAWICSDGEARNILVEIVKEVWMGKDFPKDWRKAVIVPLYKKGDRGKGTKL